MIWPRAGQPEFALDVDNVKPLGLVVGAAVAMLLAGKPLSGSRGFGGLQYGLPKIGDMNAKVRRMAASTYLDTRAGERVPIDSAARPVWQTVVLQAMRACVV